MLVIAHRGASAQFTENTLDAFLGAVDQGADGVELDVRRTSDDHLAIHHDDGLADGTRRRGDGVRRPSSTRSPTWTTPWMRARRWRW